MRDARSMQSLLRERQISAVELLITHIEHIEHINPKVNAIVTECFDKALNQAGALDASGEFDKPLAGLPIAHKDLVSTKDLRTTFGSTLYRDHIPDKNDYIIDRMQQGGAITIGKTNVPEFGAGSHTFNRVFGPSRNPYDLDRTCGGSSGGAAVALATRMTALADGSDLGGSLRNPGAFCNVIGFRPTNNLLPPTLDGDHAMNLAALGPMARSVDDVALLFGVLLNESSGPFHEAIDPLQLSELRVAVTEDFGILPVVPEIKTRIREFAVWLESTGATVEDATPDLADSREIFQTIRGLSFRRRYDDFSEQQKTELKPTILWNVAKGRSITDEQVTRVQSMRHKLATQIARFFDTYDFLVGPTTQVLPFPIPVEWIREIDGVQMDTYIDWMESCSLITTTECPAMSLPGGFAEGLPVGIQLIARRHEDLRLLQFAKAVEADFSSAATLPQLVCGD